MAEEAPNIPRRLPSDAGLFSNSRLPSEIAIRSDARYRASRYTALPVVFWYISVTSVAAIGIRYWTARESITIFPGLCDYPYRKIRHP
jgi:hypothetical protein